MHWSILLLFWSSRLSLSLSSGSSRSIWSSPWVTSVLLTLCYLVLLVTLCYLYALEQVKLCVTYGLLVCYLRVTCVTCVTCVLLVCYLCYLCVTCVLLVCYLCYLCVTCVLLVYSWPYPWLVFAGLCLSSPSPPSSIIKNATNCSLIINYTLPLLLINTRNYELLMHASMLITEEGYDWKTICIHEEKRRVESMANIKCITSAWLCGNTTLKERNSIIYEHTVKHQTYFSVRSLCSNTRLSNEKCCAIHSYAWCVQTKVWQYKTVQWTVFTLFFVGAYQIFAIFFEQTNFAPKNT